MTHIRPQPHCVLAFRLITGLRLQKMLAERLVSLGWRVTFLLWDEGGDIIAKARREIDGLAPFVFLDQFRDDGDTKLEIQKSHPSPLRSAAANAFCKLSFSRELVRYHTLHRRMIAKSLAALTELAPSALVVTEDGVTSNFRLLAAARHLSVPIIVVPYVLHAKFHFDVDMEQKERAGDLRIATGWNRVVLRTIAPQWLKTGRMADAIFFPPAFILAFEALGVSVPDPWTLHGGIADILCVESEVMKQHYIREGVPLSKMAVTGSPFTDEVMDSLALDERARWAFRQPRWIEPERPRILVTWAVDRHAVRGQFSEFSTYAEMTRAFFRYLAGLKGVAVTVSLPPGCTTEDRLLVENEGFCVSNDNFISLIARNDILVAQNSSTRRWALASGKPVISYDTYNMEHHQLDAPGFITTRSFDDVKTHLERLTKSPDAFAQIAAAQCGVAENWGIMDGRCTSRIAELIARVSSVARAAGPAGGH